MVGAAREQAALLVLVKGYQVIVRKKVRSQYVGMIEPLINDGSDGELVQRFYSIFIDSRQSLR